jgi:hypothetical protein
VGITFRLLQHLHIAAVPCRVDGKTVPAGNEGKPPRSYLFVRRRNIHLRLIFSPVLNRIHSHRPGKLETRFMIREERLFAKFPLGELQAFFQRLYIFGGQVLVSAHVIVECCIVFRPMV